jgi:hypothetical protein
VQNGG